MNILSYNYHTVCESAAHDFFATVDIPGGLSPPSEDLGSMNFLCEKP